MRKRETLKIDDREVTVFELRVFEIAEIGQMLIDTKGEPQELAAQFRKILPMATTLKPREFEKLAPSEIMELWAAFRRVNAAFFDLWGGLRKEGLLPVVTAAASKTGSQEESSSSSPGDTAIPGTTAGDGSFEP